MRLNARNIAKSIITAIATTLICAACIDPRSCDSIPSAETIVVLTFDDGPLPADVDPLAATTDENTLLDPLGEILDTLRARDAAAVFFVKGPGTPDIGDQVASQFADGLSMIHDDGHLLGYHAYAHLRDIWAPIIPAPLSGQALMRRDLDALVAYVNETLSLTEYDQSEVFSPIFRQPYGGIGKSATQGLFEALRRGWTVRGFHIDSVDWTDHLDADPNIADTLPVGSDAQHLTYTLARPRDGATRHAGRPVVDVLLHVNTFTAKHLDTFIAELGAAFRDAGAPIIRFDVPTCYLDSNDLFVDRTALIDSF